MKQFLRIFFPCFANPTQLPTVLSTDAEAWERFSTASQLIIESQKQYLESLKLSLNMWSVINSGAAIALINNDMYIYRWNILAFMAGAVISGIGNILLFALSQELIKNSFEYVLDKENNSQKMFSAIYKVYGKSADYSVCCLVWSYVFFTLSIITLL